MDKKIRNQRIIIVLLAVLLIFNFFSLMDMSSRLDSLESNIGYRFENISSNMNNILSEIAGISDDNKEKASLVAALEYEYGELEKGNSKIPVKVKITPKTVTEDTALFLELGTRTVEIKKSEGTTAFVAEFETDVFAKTDDGNVKLVIKRDGVSESEELDWRIDSMHNEYLPSIWTYFAFDKTEYSSSKGLTVRGSLIFVGDREDNSFENMKLIFKLNDEVVSVDEISVPEKTAHSDEINKTFAEAKPGDSFELCIEGEDDYGYIHEKILKKIPYITEDVVGADEEELNKEIIKDKEGNVLYS